MVVDWKKLEKIVEDLKEKYSDEEEKKWYRALEGSSPYKKLKSLRSLCNKTIEVCDCSKRCWDKELLDQLRKMRRTRKGKEGERINQEGRVRRWKAEKKKLRMMVKEKKKQCWKIFCEENGVKDP